MLNSYRNTPPSSKSKRALAAAQAAQAAAIAAAQQPEPITEAEILAAIEQYNQVEAAAHELKRIIFTALSQRHGYRQLRIGQGGLFNGTEAAFAAWQNEKPHLIAVESLGGE